MHDAALAFPQGRVFLLLTNSAAYIAKQHYFCIFLHMLQIINQSGKRLIFSIAACEACFFSRIRDHAIDKKFSFKKSSIVNLVQLSCRSLLLHAVTQTLHFSSLSSLKLCTTRMCATFLSSSTHYSSMNLIALVNFILKSLPQAR